MLMEEKIAVLEIKARCIQYLRDNPERFVESDEETSWLEYVIQYVQEYGLIIIDIQAVADAIDLKIRIRIE